jgi:DNA-directed RNA polymerase subunit H (RpoH/RPB5)
MNVDIDTRLWVRVVHEARAMLSDRGCASVYGPATPHDIVECVLARAPVARGTALPSSATEVYVVHPEEKVGVKTIRSILENCLADAAACDDGCVILVSKEGPTPMARKIEDPNCRLQYFTLRDLCMNPTRHALVPRHVRVDEPPEGVDPKTLPLLLMTDRIVRHYDWCEGTVVRIERCYGGHEPILFFRRVGTSHCTDTQ